jgi:NhaP-type Na+/H+ and K+/H+ antiporter
VVDPPALPARFNQMITVLAVGSVLWAVAAVVVAATTVASGRPLGLLFLTCVVGAGLGGVGYSIFAWQRAAARRGSRGAQRGLD